MALEKISKIQNITDKMKILPGGDLGGMDTTVMRQRFETLMRDEGVKTHQAEAVTRDPNKAVTPMDAMGQHSSKAIADAKVTPDSIVSQVQETTNRIETVKARIAADDVAIKPTMSGMLRKKLHHIDSNIQAALDKAGATEADLQAAKNNSSELVDGAMNPIHRFIGLLTHGQHNLQMIEEQVKGIGTKNLNPTMLMSIQLKVARVQQEIELFTSLLNKALESTKTIMNIQV